MVDKRFTPFAELEELFNPDFVGKQTLNTMKIVRGITGEGLRETKEWVEKFLQPTMANMSQPQNRVLDTMPDFNPDEILRQLESLRRDVANLKRANTTANAKGIFE